MTLFKTSFLSFIATAIKILAGLTINKAISLYVGPSGLALAGQFQNFTQILMTVAQGGINHGVTKYSAEYGKNEKKLATLFSTATKISLASATSVGLGTIILSTYASENILNSKQYSYIFVIFGLTVILFVINNLILSILNGISEITIWIKINIIQSLYALVFTTLLIVFFSLEGALIALATNQSITFLIILWILRKHPTIRLKNFSEVFDSSEAKKLGKFAAMALTSAVTIPLSQLIVRNHIGETIGWNEAGYWQAIQYISTTYLMIVTTTLSTYYLPRLSLITTKTELKKELTNAYKIIMPIVIISSCIIFILKDLIIWMLFTNAFLPMRELFLWQLIGDILKLAAWLLALLMIAKAMTKEYIYSEIAFSISFVALSIPIVNKYGLIGMSYSFAVNYGLYLVVTAYITRDKWNSRSE